jgi:TPP-dependent pyruvate/acetoin dehydrogenase alpha subunit
MDPFLASVYRSLYRIRRVEEEIVRLYPSDKIKSPVHLSIGQESVSVGVCEALRPDDIVFGTYRNHALYLAKGGDLNRMMAELYGKATGCAKGKGGSMHLVDIAAGVMGGSAVVGTTIPQAVGYALALELRGRPQMVASFFGDGAVEEGAFHESLNFAALKKLPIVFICENNLYAIHSKLQDRQPVLNLCERARAYGMNAERIEGGDVLRIHERVADVRARGTGPWFFECMTYRWKEHVGPGEDFQGGYRSREEAAPWIAGDEVARIGGVLDSVTRARIEADAEKEIAGAIAFAEASPFPDAAELHTDVFA